MRDEDEMRLVEPVRAQDGPTTAVYIGDDAASDALDRAAAGVDATADAEAARALGWIAAPVLQDVAEAVMGGADGLGSAAERHDWLHTPDAERAAGRDDDPYGDLVGQ